MKLEQLKFPLRKLNVKCFGHISFRAEKASQDLKEAHMALHDQLHTFQGQVADLRKKALFLKEAERLFFLQKLSCNTPYCVVLSKFKELEISLRI